MSQDICSVAGCGRPRKVRGMCQPCYRKALHHGEIDTSPHRRMTPEQWFWHTVRQGPGCWEWAGVHTALGYSRIYIDGKYHLAHRFAYELLVGSIPVGMVLDHLCRNPGCVNPDHLEPVTDAENIRRGQGFAAQAARRTHCPQGHPYSGDNLRVTPQGYRICVTCRRTNDREKKRRIRALAKAQP